MNGLSEPILCAFSGFFESSIWICAFNYVPGAGCTEYPYRVDEGCCSERIDSSMLIFVDLQFEVPTEAQRHKVMQK